MTTPDNPFAAPEPGAQPGHGRPPIAEPPGYGQQQYGAPPYDSHPYPPPPGYGQQFPPYGQPPYGAPVSQSTNGMAIASMVLGILWLWWIGSLLALIFGYVAKNQIRERGDSGGGMATAGIVLGWIGVGFLSLFVLFGVLGAVGSGSGY